jgi:acetoin:2,6-dichlorophenolindophenol oxidoreductase subunit beta
MATYLSALHQTLIELMRADERIVVLGQFDSPPEGPRLGDVFGPDRLLPSPVSELALAGAALGAALAGMRPIVTFGIGSFMLNAWEQVINEAPHFRYMSGGQVEVPIVLHAAGGARGAGGAQHSHSPQAMLWNTPGLRLALPASPSDVRGLWPAAVADPNPVVILDGRHLYPMTGPEDDEGSTLPLGKGRIRRAGRDLTIVATSWLVSQALAAAEELGREGIDAEVVDPRTLVPLDEELIMQSVAKTGRLVIADETHLSCGVGAEIAARVGQRAFGRLKAPIERVATADVPIPFSPALEAAVVPRAPQILAAARRAAAYPEAG